MASTALASPALARDGQWYVGVEGGAMIVEDTTFDIGATGDRLIVEADKGYDVGGFVGYDFGAFRLEAEASYRDANLESVTVGSTGLGVGPNVARAGLYPAGGSVNVLSFMLNGMFDFGPDDGLQGFVGGGVGVARTSMDGFISRSQPSSFDDSDSGFAWQVLAGVRAPLSDNVDVGLRYRMFNSHDVQLSDSRGRTLQGDVRTHSIMGTLSYNFGAPAVVVPVAPPRVAPPPPPPPPPAPTPAPRAVCETGPYIVFFNFDRSDITPEAATILDNAVTAYANCGMASVMLAGHTDRAGSAQYNLGLSQRRNASVRDYLSARGIPNARINSQAFGETQPRVPTADGVRELQNRRVEITYGPGSGM